MKFVDSLRKNIGTIVACLGFILLCIVTFGDLGELFTAEYWANVQDNLLGISLVSIGLTFIQTAIKQGVAEQALQRGLNTQRTQEKYEEHSTLIKDNIEKQIYLPYFLRIYNERHTKLRRQEYLVNNNYLSERALYASGRAKLIQGYEAIQVHITAASIKWSTINVVYDKYGRIITLNEYRKIRAKKSLISSLVIMIGTTFIAGGLFFTPNGEPLWQKFVKLFTYCLTIAISVIFAVIKEYEKGAFGVPNDLEEINQIWREFSKWEAPDWVIDDIENTDTIYMEVNNEHRRKKRILDSRTDLQKKQEESEGVYYFGADNFLPVSLFEPSVLLPNDEKQSGECDRDFVTA
jgi:hypothetical protein